MMLQAPERLSHFDFWEVPLIITGAGGVWFLKELPYRCLCIISISIPIELQSTHLSGKGQKTNLLHFMGHVVSMATTPLCTHAASDNQWVNGCGCASINLHVQKWEVGGICSDGCSLLTLPQRVPGTKQELRTETGFLRCTKWHQGERNPHGVYLIRVLCRNEPMNSILGRDKKFHGIIYNIIQKVCFTHARLKTKIKV